MPATLYADHTAAALAERVGPDTVVVQPIGAVEQHGPHMPVSTDALVAERAARAAAEAAADVDVLVLPTLSYGVSTEHTWCAGTISLSPTTMLALLSDLAGSLARLDARRLVFVNAHGGNTPILTVACREIRAQFGLLTFLVHPMLPPDRGGNGRAGDEQGLGVHAGHDETSVVMHLEPELVAPAEAVRNVPEWLAQQHRVGFSGAASVAWLSSDLGASGVIGDPTGASSARGAECFAEAVASMGEALREIAAFDFPDRAGAHATGRVATTEAAR